MEDNFDIKKLVGYNLKKLRLRHKLTQEKFAEKIGIEASNVSRIESGEQFLSTNTINNIIKTFNIEPQMLCIREKDYNIEQAYQEILVSIEKLKTNKTLFKLAYDYITELEKELD